MAEAGPNDQTTPAAEPSATLAPGEVPFILERLVPFTRELSVIAVRARTGETAVYPLVENHHRGGILRLRAELIVDLVLMIGAAQRIGIARAAHHGHFIRRQIA